MSVELILNVLTKKIPSKCVTLIRNLTYIIIGFICKLTCQEETSILTYHSVDSSNDFLAVDPKEFRRQIEYLRKNYTIVSLDEIVSLLQRKSKMLKKSVAITFDDGYEDFYFNVYPYFLKKKLTATVFLATGYVGEDFPFGDNRSKILTWKEAKEMSENSIEIGAHTVTHPNLQEISLSKTKDEILKSKKEIEEHINKSVNFFSYPFGRFTPEIIDIVESSGFKGGLGGEGTIRKDANLFALNRIQVDSSISFLLFKARLTKAVDWVNRFERIAKKKNPSSIGLIFQRRARVTE